MSKETYHQELKDRRWQRRAAEIKEKRGWKCEICQDKYNPHSRLEVHHIRYDEGRGRRLWDYYDGELMCLCEKCHEFEHFKDRAYYILKENAELKERIRCYGGEENLKPCEREFWLMLHLISGSIEEREMIKHHLNRNWIRNRIFFDLVNEWFQNRDNHEFHQNRTQKVEETLRMLRNDAIDRKIKHLNERLLEPSLSPDEIKLIEENKASLRRETQQPLSVSCRPEVTAGVL